MAQIDSSRTVIALSQSAVVFEVGNHGYSIRRIADLAEATFYGDDQVEKFRDAFPGDDKPDSAVSDEQITAADEFLAWCESNGELSTCEPLRTWSVVIAWSNTEHELGTFGSTVRAVTSEAAEEMVRWQMWWIDRESYDRDEEPPADIDDQWGDVQDCSPGATWEAQNLEAALRRIVDWAQNAELDAPAIAAGKAALLRVDQIANKDNSPRAQD